MVDVDGDDGFDDDDGGDDDDALVYGGLVPEFFDDTSCE